MRDVESALLETEQFSWSNENGQFAIEEDANAEGTYTVVAGIPNDDDEELLLERWLTAVFLAVPDAAVEDADVIETDRWGNPPSAAVRITFAAE